ncbi:hypothetical protein Pelo_5354 [Pelomyxa schiedti]|nr:hypothetical protein Pelo_5354 [Pelomyxa schiedti]
MWNYSGLVGLWPCVPIHTRNNRTNLPDAMIRSGIRARDQLTALLVGSQCERCGVCSPARRVFGPGLARQLWDTWVIGTQRTITIVVELSPNTPQPGGLLLACLEPYCCSLRIGVSMLLFGMTTGLCVTNGDADWVDENVEVTESDLSDMIRVTNVARGESCTFELSEVAEPFSRARPLCMNGKWGLRLRVARNLLTIIKLNTKKKQEPVDAPIPDRYCVKGSMSFNKLCSSQALIVMSTNSGRDAHLLVIDLDSTYTTRTLQIVSSTRCQFPEGHFLSHSVRQICLMKNNAGKNVFIVETSMSRNRDRTVFAVQFDGTVTRLSSHSQAIHSMLSSQINGSLFSLLIPGNLPENSKENDSILCCDPDKLEIWDCNDTAIWGSHQQNPVMVYTVPSHKGHLSGGGLIVLITGGNTLQVTEAVTGHIVASIEYAYSSFPVAVLYAM